MWKYRKEKAKDCVNAWPKICAIFLPSSYVMCFTVFCSAANRFRSRRRDDALLHTKTIFSFFSYCEEWIPCDCLSFGRLILDHYFPARGSKDDSWPPPELVALYTPHSNLWGLKVFPRPQNRISKSEVLADSNKSWNLGWKNHRDGIIFKNFYCYYKEMQ